MSDLQQRLASIQQPRVVEENQNMAMVCEPLEVLNLEQWIERECPDWVDVQDIIESFNPQDRFLKTVTINGEVRRPFLINKMPTMEPFIVLDYEQFINRLVTQEGFAARFSIHIVARPRIETLVTPVPTKKIK